MMPNQDRLTKRDIVRNRSYRRMRPLGILLPAFAVLLEPLGAILGPLIAGELIRRQWPSGDVFRAAVVPALVAMAAMLLMRLAPGPERAAGMDS